MTSNILRKHAHVTYCGFFSAVKIENFIGIKKKDISNIFAQTTDCGYTLEPPRGGGSNEHPLSMFWSKIKKTGISLHIPVLLF